MDVCVETPVTTTDPTVKFNKNVELVADALRRGIAPPDRLAVEQMHATGKFKLTWAEFQPIRSAAVALVQAETRKAKVAAKLAESRQKLKENDTSIPAPTSIVDKMEAAIRELVSEDDLEAHNAELRKRSGSLTFRDVAFIGVIHWNSVRTNGAKDERFKNTSPFDRIKKASTASEYRKTPFDDRQIRYALGILEAVEFTTEVSPAIRSPNKSVSRAAVWSLSDDPFWTLIFA